MDEWRARNAEMNEQVRQMEREVEEEDVREGQKMEADREREQSIEEDKGRSTKNITVSMESKL